MYEERKKEGDGGREREGKPKENINLILIIGYQNNLFSFVRRECIDHD